MTHFQNVVEIESLGEVVHKINVLYPESSIDLTIITLTDFLTH